MKIESNRNISFKGFYNNKTLKKGLEFAADNGQLFAATTTLALSMFARPVAISLTPKTDKENRIVACAKSIASSITQFGVTFAIATPLANAIEKINQNPENYLKKETIKTFKKNHSLIRESSTYKFATQLFKLGIGIAIAVPKSIITAAFMPVILSKVFHKKNNKEQTTNLSFKGKGEERIAKNIAKILDKKPVQKFSEKYKDSNFVMHIIAATDTLSTATFVHQTYKSKKIEEDRKKALIYNSIFSTALSIASGYFLDKLTDKPTEKFIKKFKEVNKNDKNLEKQLEGIKIAKPMLLVGGVYYILIPVISTLLAEFTDNSRK